MTFPANFDDFELPRFPYLRMLPEFLCRNVTIAGGSVVGGFLQA